MKNKNQKMANYIEVLKGYWRPKINFHQIGVGVKYLHWSLIQIMDDEPKLTSILKKPLGYLKLDDLTIKSSSTALPGYIGLEFSCKNSDQIVAKLYGKKFGIFKPMLIYNWPNNKRLTVFYLYKASNSTHKKLTQELIEHISYLTNEKNMSVCLPSLWRDHKFKVFHDSNAFIIKTKNK